MKSSILSFSQGFFLRPFQGFFQGLFLLGNALARGRLHRIIKPLVFFIKEKKKLNHLIPGGYQLSAWMRPSWVWKFWMHTPSRFCLVFRTNRLSLRTWPFLTFFSISNWFPRWFFEIFLNNHQFQVLGKRRNQRTAGSRYLKKIPESKNRLFQELQNHERTTGFRKNPPKNWRFSGQLFEIFTKFENLFEKSPWEMPLVLGIWGEKKSELKNHQFRVFQNPQRDTGLHEKTDKEGVIFWAVIWLFQKKLKIVIIHQEPSY